MEAYFVAQSYCLYTTYTCKLVNKRIANRSCTLSKRVKPRVQLIIYELMNDIDTSCKTLTVDLHSSSSRETLSFCSF